MDVIGVEAGRVGVAGEGASDTGANSRAYRRAHAQSRGLHRPKHALELVLRFNRVADQPVQRFSAKEPGDGLERS